jgi:hypothetical protein
MVSNLLNELMHIYLQEYTGKTNAESQSHKLLISQIPVELKKVVDPLVTSVFDPADLTPQDILVVGSEGKAKATQNPWVCIYDKKITTTAQQGIYIAILYKMDMSGFYLALNQGITYFKENCRDNGGPYKNANFVANYFRSKLQLGSFADKIDLGNKKGTRGYGYEQTTVLSKLFVKDHFTEEDFVSSLKELLLKFRQIVLAIGSYKYSVAVSNVLSQKGNVEITYEKATTELREALGGESKQLLSRNMTQIDPRQVPPNELPDLSTPTANKIDWMKRARETAETGLLGELLVLEFENTRLTNESHSELVSKVDWVADRSDVAGYDITSWVKQPDGSYKKIYIEVKTTTSKLDGPFFVSRCEVTASARFKESYYIYRVYDCDSLNPKFYVVRGAIEDNFVLNNENYQARIRPNADIVSQGSIHRDISKGPLSA